MEVYRNTVVEQNVLMASYWNRKRSFRKVRRFTAVDQSGTQHTVVHRIETLQSVGLTNLVIEAEQGVSCFYSATSGDAVKLQEDGFFATNNGKLRLRADAKVLAEIMLACKSKSNSY